MHHKEKLRSGQTLLGTLISLSDTASIDALSRVGYDWLWLDMEHSPFSLENIKAMLDAKSSACLGLVRVPINSAEWIKRVLDIGADGIIVPHVSTVEDAKRAVQAAKYPPEGFRSYGPGRASHYGIDKSYVANANNSVIVAIQIEHKNAVDNLEEILSVEGVDAVVVGPFDLSGSYGELGQVEGKTTEEAIERISAVCKQKGVVPGIFCPNAEFALKHIKNGFRLINIGVDINTMWMAAQTTVNSVREQSG